MFGRLGVLTDLSSFGAYNTGASDDEAVTITARLSLTALTNSTALAGFGSVSGLTIETDPAAEYAAISALDVTQALAAYTNAAALSNIAAVTATPRAGYTATVGISNIAGVSIERTVGYSWTNTEGSDFEAQADGTGWDDTYRAAVDQLISDLKSGQINGSNVYSGFDRILLMDAPNQADSLRYLNAPTVTAAAVNSPTFTATEGFAGNGSSMYIDLNFTPSTDGSQFALNSASAAVWMRTANTQSFGTALGGYGSASSQLTGIPLWTSGAGNVGAQGPSSSTRYTATSTAATGFTGLMGINRSGASAQQIYVDGAADGTASNSSTALSTAGLHLFRENRNGTGTNYANGQMSLAFVGRSFTANEWADIYDAFNRYRTAREAA